MKPANQIIYRYNDDPATEEIDLDMDNEKAVPEEGSSIERKGERWRVVKIQIATNEGEPFEVPVHRVFLTNKQV